MAASRLRVYHGPDDETQPDKRPKPDRSRTVTVELKELLPLFDALRNDRSWVEDFFDDEITLSHDLYEVMRTYQHYRRTCA